MRGSQSLMKVTFFISSTYQDLARHREQCRELFDKLRSDLGVDWVGMEMFGVNDKPPKENSLEQVISFSRVSQL